MGLSERAIDRADAEKKGYELPCKTSRVPTMPPSHLPSPDPRKESGTRDRLEQEPPQVTGFNGPDTHSKQLRNVQKLINQISNK